MVGAGKGPGEVEEGGGVDGRCLTRIRMVRVLYSCFYPSQKCCENGSLSMNKSRIGLAFLVVFILVWNLITLVESINTSYFQYSLFGFQNPTGPKSSSCLTPTPCSPLLLPLVIGWTLQSTPLIGSQGNGLVINGD